MNKKNINKKKFSFVKKFKNLFIIILLIFIFFLLYQSYKLDFLKIKSYQMINQLSQNFNYVLKNVEINNLDNIEKKQIHFSFNNYYGESIFLIPISKISKEISKHQWVKEIKINNNFKDTIKVFIVEKKPKGIFFDEKQYLFFDENNNIIDEANLTEKNYKDLIKFKGKNSLKNANEFMNLIPFLIKNQIEYAVYVNDRRWDIKLKNKIILKLGENKIKESFENYVKIYNNISIKEFEEFESIDLRMPNKAIIKFKNND